MQKHEPWYNFGRQNFHHFFFYFSGIFLGKVGNSYYRKNNNAGSDREDSNNAEAGDSEE